MFELQRFRDVVANNIKLHELEYPNKTVFESFRSYWDNEMLSFWTNIPEYTIFAINLKKWFFIAILIIQQHYIDHKSC